MLNLQVNASNRIFPAKIVIIPTQTFAYLLIFKMFLMIQLKKKYHHLSGEDLNKTFGCFSLPGFAGKSEVS